MSLHLLGRCLGHCLARNGNVELVEGERHSLQILAVLHPVDEVTAHDVRLVGERVVRAEYLHTRVSTHQRTAKEPSSQ
jgi:hypothetical protein